MKSNYRVLAPGFRVWMAACLSLATVGMLAGAAWAQKTGRTPPNAPKPSPIPSVIPSMPQPPPADLPFSQEAAGRRRLFALRDTIRNADAFGYTARIVQMHGAGSPTIAIETCRAALPGGQLAITTESGRGKTKTVRRAIATQGTLLVTRFEDKGDGKSPPVRDYTRSPLDDSMPLSRALNAADFAPQAACGQWLIAETAPLLRHGRVWQGSPLTEGHASFDTILEFEAAGERGGRRTITARRYSFRPEGDRRLMRFEEWTTQAERRTGRDGTSPAVTYHREDYAEWQAAKSRYPPETFDQALPGTYRETPLPHRADPLPPLPASTDPKAVVLLERWRAAEERWLSYSATVDQTIRMTERATDSRPVPDALRNAQTRCTIQVRRTPYLPGGWKMRFSRQAPPGNANPRIAQDALYVSDGSELLYVNRDSGQRRTFPLQNEGDIWRRMNATGFNDYGALSWLITDTPRPWNYTSVSYGGKATTDDGETVEVAVLERKDTGGGQRGQTVEITQTLRVGLGADGLPRLMEMTIRQDINGAFERDLPPTTTVLTRFHDIRQDSEPSEENFRVR